MKIKVEIDKNLSETEILIKTREKDEGIEKLISFIESQRQDLNIILGYKDKEAVLIEKESINYFYTQSKKVYVNSKKGTFEVKKRLYELEIIDSDFLRISNTEIVQIKEIEKIDFKYSGTILMIMKNKDELYVSRRYMPKVRAAFGLGG